ncbi:c-type cytochrome [Methylomonas sp. MgM2]
MTTPFHPRTFFLWLIAASACRADVGARAIALNCLNCHRYGPSFSDTEIPALNRLSEQQLRQMLFDFKYDGKPATLMPRIAKGYSDRELAAVAEFLAGNSSEQ